MIEIKLKDDGDFLKIKETLTRVGIANKDKNRLTQSCHILHKRDKRVGKNRYFIVHYKEFFLMDGKSSNITEDDINRLNAIVLLLEEWGLCESIDPVEKSKDVILYIIPFKDKSKWELVPKYNMGVK